MSNIEFNGRVAIVTGAGRGLGREYARDIARRGGKVVVADVGGVNDADRSWAQKVVEEIRTADGTAVACHETVSTSEGGRAIVESALDHFGQIDAVIHNAGFLRPAYFDEMTDAQLREVIDVHLMGAFHVGRPAWKVMKKRGYGRIVLTSSSAVFGYPGSCNYVAAKAGLLGLTTALAEEGRSYNIRVNAILPYAVSNIVVDNPTSVVPSPEAKKALRALEPLRHFRSVLPLAVYLASEACETTGQAYSALSGRYARVALQLAKGWIGDANSTMPEDIAANLAQIAQLNGGMHPQSMYEEIESVYADLHARGIV